MVTRLSLTIDNSYMYSMHVWGIVKTITNTAGCRPRQYPRIVGTKNIRPETVLKQYERECYNMVIIKQSACLVSSKL